MVVSSSYLLDARQVVISPITPDGYPVSRGEGATVRPAVKRTDRQARFLELYEPGDTTAVMTMKMRANGYPRISEAVTYKVACECGVSLDKPANKYKGRYDYKESNRGRYKNAYDRNGKRTMVRVEDIDNVTWFADFFIPRICKLSTFAAVKSKTETMRKNLFAVVLLCALALAGCKTKIDTQALNALTSLSQITPADIKTRSLTVADSVEQNHIKGTVKIEADFPESGNFFVINNIREWMSEQMGGTYEGSLENGQKMMEHYKSETLKDFQSSIIPDMPAVEGISCYKEHYFAKSEETDRYVTYYYAQEGYAGGAHGWHIALGQTFRKSDGRRIDYDIFREELKDELAELVKDNIFTQYFESDKNDMENLLTMENNDYFPLPVSSPYFTADGVVFTYQQYEIAAYAAGLPSCVITYDLIEPFLTQAGRELVNITHVAEN